MTTPNEFLPDRNNTPDKTEKNGSSTRLDQWKGEALKRRNAFANLTSIAEEEKVTFQVRMEEAIQDRFEHTRRIGTRAMRDGLLLAALIIFIPAATVPQAARWMGIPDIPLDVSFMDLIAVNLYILFGSLVINLLSLWLNNFSLLGTRRGSETRFGSWLVITVCLVLGYMLYQLVITKQAPISGLSPFASFVGLYLALLTNILMWLTVFHDSSINFFQLTRLRSRTPESIIVTDLLDLLNMLEASKDKFHQSQTRLQLVQRISIVADSLRQELPRAYPVRQTGLTRYIYQKAQEMAAAYDRLSQNVVMSKPGGFEDLRKQIASDLLHALRRDWDGFQRIPFEELLEQNQRIRLRRIIINLVTGVVPMGLLWIVQLFSFELSDPAIDYIRLFAFFWLIVSLFSILDSDYSTKIGSLEKLLSIGRGRG